MAEAKTTVVYASMPKFNDTCTVELAGPLVRAGMTEAFDADRADFSLLGESKRANTNIYIDRVLHKTYISVAEKGTRAGAATVVMAKDGAAIWTEESKQVYLNRPFLYMIIDCASKLPVFLGTVTDLS